MLFLSQILRVVRGHLTFYCLSGLDHSRTDNFFDLKILMQGGLEKTRNRPHLLLLCICQLSASQVHCFGRMAVPHTHPMASTAITRINSRVFSLSSWY